jgi:hypothetical protein
MSVFIPSGTKHFLLMCNVKAEDSGEIRFVTKQTESTAYLEVEGRASPTGLQVYLTYLCVILQLI